MRKRNTESIGEAIRQYFENNPFLKKKVAESRVLSGWSILFGNTIKNYTTGIYLKNGVLFIKLSSPILRVELEPAKEKMIQALNNYAGMEIVENIIFR